MPNSSSTQSNKDYLNKIDETALSKVIGKRIADIFAGFMSGSYDDAMDACTYLHVFAQALKGATAKPAEKPHNQDSSTWDEIKRSCYQRFLQERINWQYPADSVLDAARPATGTLLEWSVLHAYGGSDSKVFKYLNETRLEANLSAVLASQLTAVRERGLQQSNHMDWTLGDLQRLVAEIEKKRYCSC